jgi:hypothetical protein
MGILERVFGIFYKFRSVIFVVPEYILNPKHSIAKIIGKFNLENKHFYIDDIIYENHFHVIEKLKNRKFREFMGFNRYNRLKMIKFKMDLFIYAILIYENLLKIPSIEDLNWYRKKIYYNEAKLASSLVIGLVIINRNKVYKFLFSVILTFINTLVKRPIRSIFYFYLIYKFSVQIFYVVMPKDYIVKKIFEDMGYVLDSNRPYDIDILADKVYKKNILIYGGARCRDGTISNSKGRGTCSYHGGVWYWVSSGSCAFSSEECYKIAQKLNFDVKKTLTERSLYYKILKEYGIDF